MHEHGLADDILKAVAPRFAEVPPGCYLRLRLRVSELSGLRPEPLQLALDHAHEQHEAPLIRLELHHDGLLGQCADCERLVVVGEDLRCADCGGERVELRAGESVLIEDVAVCPADSLESDAGMD